jgi:two-component system NarL family response regulator
MSPRDIGLRGQVLHTERRIPHVEELPLARVLIVDDQPDFRRHLSRLLSRAGFENVDEADTIGAAETSVAANCPDLALVDLMLPDVDGLEGTPRLKALCPRLRVIVISVLSNRVESLRAAAVAAGAEDFFPKDALSINLVRSWRPDFFPQGLVAEP